MECSWRLCPIPGMYAVTSTPLVSRTRATLRSAEFGFFGVFVNTRVHTPRRWGAPFSAPVLPFALLDSRPLRTSCWIVGTLVLRLWNRIGWPLTPFTTEPAPLRGARKADGPGYGASGALANRSRASVR